MRIISGACGVRRQCTTRGVDGILAGHTQALALPVLAVFDGMGGESCGEMAASAPWKHWVVFMKKIKKASKKSRWFFSQEPVQI